MKKRSFVCLLMAGMICLMSVTGANALKATTMTVGSQGDLVKRIQQALIDLGYLKDKADGIFGPKTENAVITFQRAQGLTADGLAGTGTQNRLFSLIGTDPVVTAPAVTTAAVKEPVVTAAPTTNSATSTLLFGGNYTTLKKGSTGSRVKLLQQCLITLKYLTDKADGKFGIKTENAVIAFQKANGLTRDGLAGKNTLKQLEKQMANPTANAAESTVTTAPTAAPTATPTPVPTVNMTYSSVNLTRGSKGEEVTLLQTRLAELRYTVTVNGTYDDQTRQAVIAFQQRNKLTADGIAGKNTKKVLFTDANPVTGDQALPTIEEGLGRIDPPAASQIKLLHWYDDIKPTIRSGQVIQIYEPVSGLAWNLRLYSLGHHADSEPLTQQDTDIMYAAFGYQNTWNQKAVYVKLPSGTWVIASMHNVPHLSGSIKDNGFDGHLCVHFPRTMVECEKNDPDYGVANQKTIRAAWKALSGWDVPY